MTIPWSINVKLEKNFEIKLDITKLKKVNGYLAKESAIPPFFTCWLQDFTLMTSHCGVVSCEMKGWEVWMGGMNVVIDPQNLPKSDIWPSQPLPKECLTLIASQQQKTIFENKLKLKLK